MCGICGIVNLDRARPVSGELLSSMCGTLTHRGPDDEGISLDGNVGIGMRRLSVIDVTGGHQPIANESDTCRIVFNGEIYNHQELRRQCEQRRHRFTTRTDSESILHLYEDFGQDCVQSLNGMFAFAIHDRGDNSLFLARDRLGIKPLYYAELDGVFLFTSEIKALTLHPAFDPEVDPVALDQYLSCKYVPGPRTIYRQVRQLPPGHTLRWRDGRIDIRSYWNPSYADVPPVSEQAAAEELLSRLEEAVRMQMISDVPLGALLSGGIDSSLIVALMAKASNRPVQTFSIGFEEPSYNELPHAGAVARAFGTEHHELVVKPDIATLFERVVGQFDEPFGDSSAVPAYLVSELARQHVTVALSGTGADELFAGYERYRAVPMSNALGRLPRRLLSSAAWALRHLPSGHAKRSVIHRAGRFLDTLNEDPLARHRGITGLFHPDERIQATLASDSRFSELWEATEGDSELDRLLGFDTRTLLADDYLVKDDRMSMAHSLELRVPFLDHTLVEFAASLPAGLKLRWLCTKYILKKAARHVLPTAILKRPKHGFEMPVARWIGSDLREHVRELLQKPGACVNELIRPETIRSTIDQHVSGRANHASRIWSLLTLEMWFRSASR